MKGCRQKRFVGPPYHQPQIRLYNNFIITDVISTTGTALRNYTMILIKLVKDQECHCDYSVRQLAPKKMPKIDTLDVLEDEITSILNTL